VNLYRDYAQFYLVGLCKLFLPKFDFMRALVLFTSLTLLALSGQAQDRITMMSGVVVPCTIVDNEGIDIAYSSHKKFDVRYFSSSEVAKSATWRTRGDSSTWCPTRTNAFERIFEKGKVSEKLLHRSDVFSIQFEDKEEQVLYALDEVLGDWMTLDEMRIYMSGEQDARNNYKAKWAFYAGLPIGATTAFLAQGGLILTIGGPVLYTLVQLAPNIRIREKTITNPVHKYNEIYALGYERVARSRIVVQALKGSAIGMAAGIAGYFLFPLED